MKVLYSCITGDRKSFSTSKLSLNSAVKEKTYLHGDAVAILIIIFNYKESVLFNILLV